MPNPIPGGKVGRTDEGVDVSSTPGTVIRDPVPGRSTLVGKVADWFQGQPLYVWLVQTGPFKGKYWYDAEQVTAPPSKTVSQGQSIGRYAPSGTATEFGWAAGPSGQTLAQATTGYTEGQVTPAGTDFLNRIIKGRGRMPGTPVHWLPCVLTWYDPALGGTNSASGRADPHSPTASGEPYSPTAMTCAAPPQYKFGTLVTFRYNGQQVTCKVNDRGRAIQGSRFDLARAPAERLGIIQAGMVQARFVIGTPGSGGSSGASRTRPGGTPPTGQGVKDVFTSYQNLVDAPRVAPPSQLASSFQWWKAEFITLWEKARAGQV